MLQKLRKLVLILLTENPHRILCRRILRTFRGFGERWGFGDWGLRLRFRVSQTVIWLRKASKWNPPIWAFYPSRHRFKVQIHNSHRLETRELKQKVQCVHPPSQNFHTAFTFEYPTSESTETQAWVWPTAILNVCQQIVQDQDLRWSNKFYPAPPQR